MTRRFAAVALAALGIMSGPVAAQTPPDVIHQDLKVGRQVSVIDEQGRRFRGRLVDASGDALTINRGRDRTVVPYGSVIRIDLVDDLRMGTRIGALVGAGLFAVEALAAREDGLTLNAAGYGVFALLYSGAGAAIGAGIDALIGGDRRLYERGVSTRVSVAPLLGRSRVGARVDLTW